MSDQEWSQGPQDGFQGNEPGGQPENGGWQNQAYGNDTYQNSGSQNGGYQNNSYQNNGYQNGTDANGYNNHQQGQPFPQSPYQGAPLRPEGSVPGLEPPMSVGEWLLTMLVLAIPCVNLIMLFVWGFGSSEKKSRANYCKAQLIWMVIWTVILVLFYVVVLAGVIAGMS